MATGRMLKNGNSSTVVQVSLDGRDYVVKRYNIKSFLHGLSRLLRPSRAWRSWHNAHLLEMLGVGTAAPIAMIERRIGPLRRQAWFLSEAVEGADILQFPGNTPINSTPWQLALLRFHALFTTMYEYRIVHGDMKGTNLIWQADRLVVLDLDGMHQEFSTRRFRQAFQRDLDRFRANWKQWPDAAVAVNAMLDELMKLPEQAGADNVRNGGLKN
ncbi:MAG: lipopolysaccharide kinase InaA family protein [Pseudomonadales bacterium]|nr:lipopolysaccharide kinase InaA family protein [Pseudomonadales bacterium]